jgi:class 3 adenylate cyclase
MSYSSIADRFALVFDNAKIEQDFLDYYETVYSRFARASLSLLALMLFADFLLDSIAYPSLYVNSYRIIIGIPMAAAAAIFTLTQSAHKHWQLIMSIFMVVFALFLFILLIKIDEELGLGLTSWVGLLYFVVIELFCFLILGLQFRYALMSGTLVLAAFFAAMYWAYQPNSTLFAYYSFHVIEMYGLAATIGWWREKNIRKQFSFARGVEKERLKYEDILGSILPPKIVDRIKAGEHTIVEEYGEVSILFADLEGFTALAARLGPKHLIEVLNRIFTEFDRICARHQVEKIKTIGDCYMAAAGISRAHSDHAYNALCTGRDMINFLREFAHNEGLPLGIRVGIHTGPVIGGVLGNIKPHFDLWGNTVNLANHMESHCEQGMIQITETTWFRVQKKFHFNGKRDVVLKGKHVVTAYLHDPATPLMEERVKISAAAQV